MLEEKLKLGRKLADCIIACNYCLDACLDEEDVKMMKECIRHDKQCVVICIATLEVLHKNSYFLKDIIALCAKACEECAKVCGQHHNDHCQACAKACKECVQACRDFLQVLK